MQEKESLLANLRLTTSQATSNQTAAVYTSPVPTEGDVNLEGHIMAIRVVEFSNGGYRFLPKNQHTQRKLFNFENWISGGLRSFQK